MKHSSFSHQRLRNLGIYGATFEQPGEAVDWLTAAQAQDFGGAKWALGLRMQNATDEDIERAFDTGTILRTHLLRPTWHFITPADIRWLLTLTAPRVHLVNGTMYRKLGLDEALLKRCSKELTKALQGKQHLTRDELRAQLKSSGFSIKSGLQMTYIVMYAELEGLVCSGPRRGKQFTYALLEERAPHARILEADEGLVELAQRYFRSRGPATVHDFAKWSGLAVAEAGKGLEEIQGQLERTELDGQTYWFPAGTQAENAPLLIGPKAHLLSVFDEYISSYKDRSAILHDGYGEILATLGNALQYILVIDGQVTGTWKRTIRKQNVTIELNPFRRLTEPENQAVAVAARRYGEFLELPVVLEN